MTYCIICESEFNPDSCLDVICLDCSEKGLVEKPDVSRLESLKRCEACKYFSGCWSFPNGKCFTKK